MKDFLEELKRAEKVIIVEGPKDISSLRKLGLKQKIVKLSKKPIYKVVEDVADCTKDAIILTDFDKKGKELYGRLRTGLERHGVRVDHKFREWLLKNTQLSHIEGLYSLSLTLETETI